MMRPKLVVIGNGMAGMRAVEELLKLAPDLYTIEVFGAEPHGNYNRILLSPVLAGEKRIDEIMLNDEQWYRDNGIVLHKGKTVEKVDRKRRTVTATDGTTAHYDRLLIATGSTPIMLPLPGKELDGVIGFRDIADVNLMLEAAKLHRRAVIIGGGLLGLEAANGLLKCGMQVTVVHLMPTLMERQLDPVSGDLLRRSLEERGLTFQMPAETEAILGDRRVTGVRLKNGVELPADFVVMAVGIRPNIDLAKRIGLFCRRGVVVNATMQTFDGRIYAVGECAESHGQTYGLVAPLFEQAKVCANHLAQLGYSRYQGSLISTKLKVTGIDLFSAGNFQGDKDSDEIVLQDASRGVYKKLIARNNRLEGAVLYGDTVDASWYFELMRDGTDISAFRDQLMFGRSHLGDSGHGGENAAMAMSDTMEVCGCNGVCKGAIVDAITQKKLFTLDDVRAHTKASSSCGSCTGLVQQILAATLGGDYSAAAKVTPICKCTDYSHDDIRGTIRRERLKTIEAVLSFMEWRTQDGCHVCRPALNYYLLCEWPDEYADDRQSRFVNERMHANIQKDGTYSVVPRFWGGVTTPGELRAIADVADKFHIPEVKVTGGQRIDLLGVKREDLPAVWRDLNAAGLVSGHAYGKALRTVKTCVGSEWCRFGTQDSTSMGIAMEKMCWGSWTPHKVKMAVSGCPRNCAEATIKDFGVVAVESGWELHIGGNGGVKIRATDLLTKVKTAEEVLEYCGAFMQLYREEAHYLERTAPWVERVGLAYVKRRLVEDRAGCALLHERFLYSQSILQQDPWAERASNGIDRLAFAPVAELAPA